MDSTEKPFTCVEWCAGYAGIHLGLKRVIPNLRTVAYGEIEAFAVANLVAKMEAGLLDAAPVWTDIKTFPVEPFRDKVDLLVAGYPCQPFSAAGKRQGEDDPRHLWPFIRQAIGIIRPRYCFFENVEGHISLGLSTVISDLEEDGYTATWGIFSASEVGAPHQRKRVFILAHCQQQGSQRLQRPQDMELQGTESQERSTGSCCLLPSRDIWPSRPGEQQHCWEPPRVVVDTKSSKHRGELRDVQSEDGEIGRSEEQHEEELWESVTASAESVGNAEHDGSHGTTDTGGSHQSSHRSEEGANLSSEPEGAGRSGNLRDIQGAVNRDVRHPEGIRQQESGQEQGCTSESSDRWAEQQVESPLGRDSHGTSNRLDNAELYESCDNRTDELRLLGNGVVVATASKAWTVLYRRLHEGNNT